MVVKLHVVVVLVGIMVHQVQQILVEAVVEYVIIGVLVLVQVVQV
jgi:hypothetical protein